MMVGDGTLRYDALDYDIVWVGTDPVRKPLGSFGDVHHVATPVWRLVSGYLMLQHERPDETADETGTAPVVGVHSHGHRIAGLAASHDAAAAELAFEGPLSPRDDDGSGVAARLRSPLGVTVLPDPGTRATVSPDRASVVLEGRRAWGATLVHGPAVAKMENRVRLLRSLERVGGRHG
ncbi:hypothetical protein N1031_11765 [Herbiconiux moechotypicola]|uniref:Uncharacterized protein n=1 Tax=Herbiconiux moechotypicola TaxID=637393 RepID=A0ABN3DNW8_9MICO|nr:hypothetical protein [Herbiconiux moechotypicola]MCS5730438.1 hypothetical protein [Herbiconiux moechotypicola]